jgi:hypothetical protein
MWVNLKEKSVFIRNTCIQPFANNLHYTEHKFPSYTYINVTSSTECSLKVGCLHPVACTRSGSGFPSNATKF